MVEKCDLIHQATNYKIINNSFFQEAYILINSTIKFNQQLFCHEQAHIFIHH